MKIDLVPNKEKCSGCGACVGICPRDAIVFQEDEEGFVYPAIQEDLCVECGACVKFCISKSEETEKYKNASREAYAAQNRSLEVLKESASGGVFSAIAEYVLEQGGYVAGCILDDSLYPKHICTNNPELVQKMRGSKYVQSDMGNVYGEVKELLKKNEKVLFTGTPCQIAALYTYLGKRNDNLITVDLVCHGVPSYRMFGKYIEYLQNKHSEIIRQYFFRTKKRGWEDYSDRYISDKNKEKIIGMYEEFYKPNFRVGNLTRPSCFKCQYACENRVGDITMGDFWGYKEKEKTEIVRDLGISIVLVNTKLGEKIVSDLKEYLVLEAVDVNEAMAGNKNLHRPVEKGRDWENYISALKNDAIEKIAKQYKSKNWKRIYKDKIKYCCPKKLRVLISSILLKGKRKHG